MLIVHSLSCFTFPVKGDGHTQQSKGGPGFYTEQFPPGIPSSLMEGLVMSSMASGNNGSQEALIASMMSQMSQAAAVSSAYESAVNYALKPEKGLPPTPPGEQILNINTYFFMTFYLNGF